MNRNEAVAYLEENFGPHRADLGMQRADNALGWKPIIDRAWRYRGVDASSLATGEPETTALNVAALRHFVRVLALRPDISGGMPNQSRRSSQAFANLYTLYQEAVQEAREEGMVIPDEFGSMTQGRILLDVLEPAPEPPWW
jgi:hypothetical protein